MRAQSLREEQIFRRSSKSFQRFNEVTITDKANQIFRTRTAFSVSPEDHARRIFPA
jgi:hypothetical protein